MKYYILKRNSERLMNEYLCDIIGEKSKISKQLKATDALLLIEKTQTNGSEHYTNLWTINEGTSLNWEAHTKKRLMYDYTGVVNLIHTKKGILTWEQYIKQ